MILELKNISKSFAKKVIVKDFSMTLKQGEVICLYGESGCGKTTILEIIAGLMSIDCGVRNCYIEQLGYAFQDDCLLPWRTLKENIIFTLHDKIKDVNKQESIANQWLEVFKLADSADKYPSQISGGMKRRLNIARALATNPQLLLLDEPFAFLDEVNCSILLDALLEFQKAGGSMVIVSHNLDKIKKLDAQVVNL